MARIFVDPFALCCCVMFQQQLVHSMLRELVCAVQHWFSSDSEEYHQEAARAGGGISVFS